VKDNNEEYVLPLLNKTSDQLFFIGYAQVSNFFWPCIVITLS